MDEINLNRHIKMWIKERELDNIDSSRDVFRLDNYNTHTLTFDNIDDMVDFIIIDDEWKGNNYSKYFDNYKIVKVWKDGRITDKNNKILRLLIRKYEYSMIGDEGNIKEREEYVWNYGRSKLFDYVKVNKIIWEVYSKKYTATIKLVKGELERGILEVDNNITNTSLFNLYKNVWTSNETEIHIDKINFFNHDVNIINDVDRILKLPEPQFLDGLNDLEIYSNGQIVDRRNKSQVLLEKKGYKSISYKGKRFLVHQLVAKCFLKLEDNLTLVNHIDGDRENNNIINLEWVNNTINTLHGRLNNRLENIDNIFLKGNISLTSKNYRNFIKDKIRQELQLPVNNWIFSYKTPLYLLYLPFSREFGIKGRWNYDYWVGGTYDQLSNYILLETFFSGSNSKYSELYKGNKKFTNKTYWFIVECINNYLSPRSKEDHLINILNRIGIDFDYYIDWLFDDLKNLLKDDTGFIFYEELIEYRRLCQLKFENGIIYINDLNTLTINNLLGYCEKRLYYKYDLKKYLSVYGGVIIYPKFHRVIEEFPNVHGFDDNKNNILLIFRKVFGIWDHFDENKD